MSLVNKYFLFSTDEYYTYGKILENLDESFYLVNKFGCEKPYDCIFHLAQLTDGSEGRTCQFFDSKIELDNYIEWVEEPSDKEKKNIIKLVKNDDKL